MNINGLLEKYGQDRFFEEVFKKRDYEAAKQVKHDVIIDVGALAGEFTAFMHDTAKVIYAIEPYSKHYVELVDNINEFGMDKVKPFRLALSNENGESELSIEARGGHVLAKRYGVESEMVPTMTLAQFMKEQGITQVDVLKIDAENAEERVFTADDFPSVAKNINFIIGEHLGQVTGLLESLGFELTRHGLNVSYRRPDGDA